jgi:hypothetical protein
MRENIQILVFGARLTSLRMMFSNSIHLPANNNISFFFMAAKHSIVYKYNIFFIHSSIVGHLVLKLLFKKCAQYLSIAFSLVYFVTCILRLTKEF